MIKLNDRAIKYIEECEAKCRNKFAEIERIETLNQLKVLNAFQNNNVQSHHFVGSTGYGHDDMGRKTLSKVFADVFHTEAAYVSALICCGTEIISKVLFGLLRPGDSILSISGIPYDSLKNVIFGSDKEDIGSLKDYNIGFNYINLIDNDFDNDGIVEAIKKYQPKLIHIQRSRGYEVRDTLSIAKI